MQTIKFTKMHWIWNDFIVINSSELKQKNIELTKDLVQKMCDRNFGIWSDWIVIITDWEKTKFKYHMYNPDWTEAEMCGNWIRCYMKYLLDEKLTDSKNVDVETGAWILNLDIDEKNIVTVDMWKPYLKHKDFPVNKWILISEDREFEYFAVSMWNPHCVIFLDENIWEFDLNKYWAPIEKNTKIFPNKVNVEFVRKVSETELDFRVYERWAGETLACWTWACASVVAWISKWLLEKNKFIKVNLQGWNLFIKWSGDKNDSVIMKWEAETVFEGEYFIK
jgi:diaminopimelate epimerase